MTELIRLARPGDETELTAMIHELAEFEHAADRVHASPKSQLSDAFSAMHPTV